MPGKFKGGAITRRNLEVKPPNPKKKYEVDLTYYELPEPHYEITKITNTAWYRPGTKLTPEIVDDLGQRENWQVNTIHNDIAGTIAGIVGKMIQLPMIGL
jgi:hypothetical protein